jgi:hypothetical protein
VGRAKGKKPRTEAEFGPHPGITVKHAENGWEAENLIVEYLQWLHTEIADIRPCVLILDVYPAHRTGAVVASAEESMRPNMAQMMEAENKYGFRVQIQDM